MPYISELTLSAILLLNTILPVYQTVNAENEHWNLSRVWERTEDGLQLDAWSKSIPEYCSTKQEHFVVFPRVEVARQLIKLDGKVVFKSTLGEGIGASSFFHQPVISCTQLANGSVLTWEVTSLTAHFARIWAFPYVSSHPPNNNFFGETLNIVAGGALILLALFNFIIFAGKVPRSVVVPLVLSCLFLGAFFVGSVPGFFGIHARAELVHKVANFCLWSGNLALYLVFYRFMLLSRGVFLFVACSILLGLGVIAIAPNPDVVELGVMIPFGLAVVGALQILTRLAMKIISRSSTIGDKLQLMSFTFFLVGGTNDVFVTIGIYNFYMIFSLAFMFALLFLSLSVNELIVQTYRERDFLRKNLEKEVIRKTDELRQAQAELVQSAKLASLGTLSAGLAHEINNSINYVNGALLPLEKLVQKSIANEAERAKIERLFRVMKDGLGLTVEIIRSLRNFSGINQAKFNDLKISEVVESVVTILRNKMRDRIELQVNVPSEITVHGSVVGLNQVFMNLVSNAIDAMPNGGKLQISAKQDHDSIRIQVADTGTGIPPEIRDRIFDPFFTTKEVGKGSGLGLHIVRKEVERHGGKISVQDNSDGGTVFQIDLPVSGAGHQSDSSAA